MWYVLHSFVHFVFTVAAVPGKSLYTVMQKQQHVQLRIYC